MIAYFEKDLLTHLGEHARQSFVSIGLSDEDIIQPEDNGNRVSFIKIIGEFDSTKCTKVVTEDEANTMLKALYKPVYTVTNSGIMTADYQLGVADGSINRAEMNPEWTESELNEWLYNKGVGGITKTVPNRYFTIV